MEPVDPNKASLKKTFLSVSEYQRLLKIEAEYQQLQQESMD